MARLHLKESKKSSTDSYDVNVKTYVDWAQQVARNLKEHNFLLDIKDTYDRNLIISNCNMFIEIQTLLKVKKPYLNDLTFEQILDYVYNNRVYFEIWNNGYWFFDSNIEILPTDEEIKKFFRLHFDPTAKKVTGSTLDKIIFWIKEGWTLESIIYALKHYFDHRKMYQDSKIFIENLDCETFLQLGDDNTFNIFKASYYILSKFCTKVKDGISANEDYSNSFVDIVRDYIKYKDNEFNNTMFEKLLDRNEMYENNLAQYLILLGDNIRGFNFDYEVETIKEAVKTNKNLTIVIENPNFFIYEIKNTYTLVKYGSPHWCIVRDPHQYRQYVRESENDKFYNIIQRNPRTKYDFKLGVTIGMSNRKLRIKHSFNYIDAEAMNEALKYFKYFKHKNVFVRVWQYISSLFKKKKDLKEETRDYDYANTLVPEPMPHHHHAVEEEQPADDRLDMEVEDTRYNRAVTIDMPRRRR